MQYRWASVEDAPLLAAFRHAQLIDEGEPPSNEAVHLQYFEKNLRNGSIAMLLAEREGEPVGAGGLSFYAMPPSFYNPGGTVAYLHSVYTKQEARRKGIASQIVASLIEEAKRRGIPKLFLQASEQGRGVYARAGFENKGSYMQLWLHE